MNMQIKILITLIITLISTNLYSTNENKIIFSIGEEIFTTIDVSNRLKYINIKENKIIDYNNGILNDYSSVLLFSKYYNELNINQDIKKLSTQTMEEIKKNLTLNKNKEINDLLKSISNEEMIKNISLDIRRKLVIENELQKKRDIIYTYK